MRCRALTNKHWLKPNKKLKGFSRGKNKFPREVIKTKLGKTNTKTVNKMGKQKSLERVSLRSTLQVMQSFTNWRVLFDFCRSVILTPVIFYTRMRGRASRRVAMTLGLSLMLVLSLGLNLTHPAPATAAASDTVNFQARLSARTGSIVADGDYNIQFKLYSASSGGSAIWTEDYLNSNTEGVHVMNGYLSVYLGSLEAFPDTIPWDQTLYVTMNIGGTGGSASWDGEMNPRLKLTAVPYAFQAKNASQLRVTDSGHVATLSFTTPTADNSIVLPNASGTVCLESNTSCGFAAATGSTNYIQNGTGLQGNTNFNIRSSGTNNITATIQALTGQTADLLRFVNVAGNAALSGFNSSGQLYYQSGSYTGTLVQDSIGQDTVYHLPDPGGSSATICLSTGNCAGSGNGITGTGTAGKLAKFTNTGVIADSNLSESGTSLLYGGDLTLAVNNGETETLPLLIQQSGGGDVGLELKNTDQSYYIGVDTSDGNKFKISSSSAAGSQVVMGSNSTIGSPDEGITNVASFAKMVAPITGTVSTIKVYVNSSGTGNLKTQAAIYASSSNLPSGSALGVTNELNATAGNNWMTFTLPSPVSVTAGTTYFLAYTSNGENNPYGAPGSIGDAGYRNFTYATGSFPTGLPSSYNTTSSRRAMYAVVDSSSGTDKLSTSLFQLSTDGAALFQNSNDSGEAFQIQNADGGMLLNVDTSGLSVNIGNASTLFNDDFESGTLGAWDSNSGLTASTNRSVSGSYSANSVSTASSSYATTNIGSTPTARLTAYVNVDSTSQDTDFMVVKSALNSYTIFRSLSDDLLCAYNGFLHYAICGDFALEDDTWTKVTLSLTAGNPGKVQVYVNDDLVINEDDAEVEGPFTSIQIGNPVGGRTANIYIDDVDLHTALNPSVALNANGDLNVLGTTKLDGRTIVSNSITNGFQIQNASTTPIFTVDNASGRVAIGSGGAETALLTIGTNTTSASGGIIFGTDTGAEIFRSGSGTLTVSGALNVLGTLSSPGAGSNSEHFGAGSTAAGTDSLALGANASAGNSSSIAIGKGAATTAANQLVIGSSTNAISSVVIGNGVTNASPAGVTIQSTGGSGSNVAGADLNLAGGTGTGTGQGGDINLQVAKPGTTGSGGNTLATVVSVSGVDGAATFQNSADSTAAFRIQNAAGDYDLLTADTTNGKVAIGLTPDGNGAMLQVGSGGIASTGNIEATGTLAGNNVRSNYNYLVAMEPNTGFGTVNGGDVIIYDPADGIYKTTSTPRDPRVVGVNAHNWVTMAINGWVESTLR